MHISGLFPGQFQIGECFGQLDGLPADFFGFVDQLTVLRFGNGFAVGRQNAPGIVGDILDVEIQHAVGRVEGLLLRVGDKAETAFDIARQFVL